MTETNRKPQFPAISDRRRFPLLAAGAELPASHLMGCEKLTFVAIDLPESIPSVITQSPLQWPFYGDARWPSESCWIEIETSPGGFPGATGILVARKTIPESEPDTFRWIAEHGPLTELFPEERGSEAVRQKTEALRQQAREPDDSEPAEPRFVQSYCLYRGADDVRLIATYTDLLDAHGVVIPRFRMANLRDDVVSLCRFALHGLFCLNRRRREGLRIAEEPQLPEFAPVPVAPGEAGVAWEQFHPSRTLRTRPAVRAVPSPGNLHKGILPLGTFETVMEARRKETNLHMLAFERESRARISSPYDHNATMTAFAHRANGGAIYLLPDALVEEFDHTDCDEIRMGDIHLPFASVFLKFTPPAPLSLDDGASVDGCYVVKQGDEYLFSLTSRWDGVDYSRSLSVTCVDPMFGLHLPAPNDSSAAPAGRGLRINEAVERGIEDFLVRNTPPTDDQSRTIIRPDGTKTVVEDIRARSRARRIEVFRSQEPVFRACLNIIVNAACFISFRPDDVTEEWDGNPPQWAIEALNDPRDSRSARDRRQHAQRLVASGDFTRIRICGKNLFRNRSAASGQGESPRAHWRRGHWRQQRHGAGLALVTPRWIRPTLVSKDNGQVVESRLYDVQADGSPH